MPSYYDKKTKTWRSQFRKRDIYGNLKQVTKRGFKRKCDSDDYERKELLTPLISKYEITLNGLWDRYIAYKIPRIKESTIKTIKERYNNHVRDEIGKLKADYISPNKYMEYQKILIKKGLAISYINNIHGDISSALKFGQKFLNVNKNVANLVGPLVDKEIKKEKTTWTPEQFKQFMAYCIDILNNIKDYSKDYMMVKAIVMIISEYVLGFRVGEGQASTYKKIDFNNLKLKITESYSPIVKELTSTKNKASYRIVSIPSYLLSLYKRLFEFDKQLDGFNLDWYIFGNKKTMSRTTLKRYRDDLCKKAKVPVITNHELRHSQASYLTNSGLNKQAIAEMLGHSPEILLTTYSHTFQTTNDEILAKQNELFS